MQNVKDITGGIFVNAAENTAKANKEIGCEDYIGPDGLMMCGICHTPREVRLPNFASIKGPIVPCLCKCAQVKRDADAAEIENRRLEMRIRDLTRKGITDNTYLGHKFANDDHANPEASDRCLTYCNNWIDNLHDNTGMILYGGVGTGKTFLACCMAFELLSHGVPVCVTNMPALIKKTSGFNSYDAVDALNDFDLLVIDDLGVERDSQYSLEQEYLIIDSRYRSRKPLIVTTNLSPSELRYPRCKDPENAEAKYITEAKERIYDRIREMCAISVKMDGQSRRRNIAAEKRDRVMKNCNYRAEA